MIAPSLPDTTNTLSLAQQPPSQADHERKDAMREAWKSYRGQFPKPLKVNRNQPDDNVISNRCEPIVNKGVSFLFGQPLKIEATDEAATDSSDVQDFIDGLWGDDDDRMTLLSQWAINGGVCGEGFLKLIPAQGQMKYPRIVVLDPQLIRIITSPDDCSLVLAYIIEYPTSGDFQKKQIIARVDPDAQADTVGEYDLDDTWTITNYMRRSHTATWYQVGEAEEWDYPFPPIFPNQNLPNPNESWGVPDLTPDLINQNKVLNFIQSNTSRIIKFHGHPKTYATGLSASQINIGVDDLLCLPSPDSKIQNLEMHGNLTEQMNFTSIIRSDMDEQSRVPAVALGRLVDLPKGNLSGVALQLLFQPLIEKTTQKRRLYGRGIRDVTRAALVIAGLIPLEQYEDYKIGLHWLPLLPIDNLASAQEALLLQQLGGISNSTIIQGLGYDPDDEADKKAQEDAQQVTAFSRGVGLPPAAPGQLPPPPGSQLPGQQQGGDQQS
jgi:hypothetical protein